jgi:hypothetical protein
MLRLLHLIVPFAVAQLPARKLIVAMTACLAAWANPSATAAQDPLVNPKPVRSTTKWGLELIAEGCQKSPSFRRLVDRLQQSNLIVYVEPVRELQGVMVGATEFAGVNGLFRYLRVSIGIRDTRKKLIALMGHELQHATEIGEAPEVVDTTSLQALYRRIGHESPDGYDTSAAREMGTAVLAELWRWRDAEPAASPQASVRRARPSINAELTRR